MVRLPNKSKKKQLAKATVDAALTQEQQIKLVSYIKEECERDPYVKNWQLEKRVAKRFFEEGMAPTAEDAVDLYRVGSVNLAAYLESGPKLAKVDALIDDLIDKAQGSLVNEVVNPDTGEVNEVIDDRVGGLILKAVDTKMKILSNMQSNLIAAKRAEDEHQVASDELNLKSATLDELRGNLRGRLVDNPEIARLISERKVEND